MSAVEFLQAMHIFMVIVCDLVIILGVYRHCLVITSVHSTSSVYFIFLCQISAFIYSLNNSQ